MFISGIKSYKDTNDGARSGCLQVKKWTSKKEENSVEVSWNITVREVANGYLFIASLKCFSEVVLQLLNFDQKNRCTSIVH